MFNSDADNGGKRGQAHYFSYLSKGLFNTKEAIRHHKLLLTILVVLQLLFFLSLGYLTITYQVQIFQNVEVVTNSLQQANFDADKIKAGEPFLENLGAVYESYNNIIQSLTLFSIWMAGLFLIYQAGLWIGTHYLLKRREQNFPGQERWGSRLKNSLTVAAKEWIKYLAASVVLLVPFLAISYFLFKNLVLTELDMDLFIQ